MQRETTVEEIGNALVEWLELGTTPRKVIARRQVFRPLQQGEAVAMKTAHELLLDGRISIITRPGFDRLGRHNITYIAERAR